MAIGLSMRLSRVSAELAAAKETVERSTACWRAWLGWRAAPWGCWKGSRLGPKVASVAPSARRLEQRWVPVTELQKERWYLPEMLTVLARPVWRGMAKASKVAAKQGLGAGGPVIFPARSRPSARRPC